MNTLGLAERSVVVDDQVGVPILVDPLVVVKAPTAGAVAADKAIKAATESFIVVFQVQEKPNVIVKSKTVDDPMI